MHIFLRIVLSVAVVVALSFINLDTNMFATITSAHLAGLQFDDSNTSAIVASTGMHHISALMGLSSLAGFIALVALWFVPFKEFFKS
jgi:hypothetical protein